MDENIEISIISPVYNESDNIEIFINKVFQVMGESSRNWELIIIDDGSTDGSRDILKKLSKDKPELRALLLSKILVKHQQYKQALIKLKESIL